MRGTIGINAPLALALALILALILAGCGSETSGTFEGEDGSSGEYTIDRSTGETTATIKTEDGTATMRSGSDVPLELPAGFTVYPGAEIVSNTVVKQAGGAGNLVTMSSDDTPEDIAAYYKAQAQDAGVVIEMEMATNGAQIVGGQSPNGLMFSIMASPSQDGTTAQLTVGNQPD